ncbi:MCE family protein [Actinomadura craniellae]|uniref:MCE family protein n=1 Tax=Actinomadura craniellae TaxID=2231787 RepID=A0A365HDI3_9ACTN|nr:MlaD family protein [Actinomadura craniellae]RAY16976.1 MCE family protein [Actinomadura craniellae]
MNQDLPRGRRIAITLATALTLAMIAYLMVAKPFADDGMRLTADFGNAGQGLTTASPVKLRGVTVGRISRIELAPRGGARLTLHLDRGVRIPDTAVAALEPESVFGPKFLNIIPGPHEATGPFLRDGTHIMRTSDSLDLTSLLGDADRVLAAVSAEDVAVIVDALGQGLGASGPNLAGLLRNTGTLVDVAHRQRGPTAALLSDLGRLARLRGMGSDLAVTIDSSAALLDTLTAGQGRGLRTARGVSEVTSLLAHGLGSHEGNLRAAGRSFEGSAAFLSAQLNVAGPGVRAVIDMLPAYGQMTRTPGPQNRRLLGANLVLPTDPCQLLLGVGDCPATPGGR